MKALTLYPVWAMLIALEKKTLETRGWGTTYRGPLAITSSARLTPEDRFCFCEEPYRSVFAEAGFHRVEDLPLGAAVCTALLTECYRTEDIRDTLGAHEFAFGNYADGRCAFRLEGVERITPPVPCKGAQGFWAIDLAACRAAASKAREGMLL